MAHDSGRGRGVPGHQSLEPARLYGRELDLFKYVVVVHPSP
jgi:hypothetical protein